MLNILIFIAFCFGVSLLLVHQYRKINTKERRLSDRPMVWLVSFLVGLVATYVYYSGSIKVMLQNADVKPILIFGSIAIGLATISFVFNKMRPVADSRPLILLCDFTLYGMQRLLGAYTVFIILFVITFSASASPGSVVYPVNIFMAWVGLGSLYGAIYALRSAKRESNIDV